MLTLKMASSARRVAGLERHERMRASMDLAVRNLRVVARRAVYLSDDGRERETAADLLVELARGADLLSSSLTDIMNSGTRISSATDSAVSVLPTPGGPACVC